jgi:glucosamine 6-phosphate synthetase-like amidotransferase/phosphosugar isomerase protein
MKGKTTLDAARAALSHLQGFIAFIAAPDGQGNALIAASNGAELFLGFDQHEALAFSDQLAVRARDAMIALRTGDVAMLSADRIAIVDVDGMRIEKRSRPIGMIAPAAAGG